MATQSALYQKIQTTYDFTDFEMQKINYTISVFKCEFSKILVLGAAFAFLGIFPEFMVMMVALIPIRRYSGGIHFKRYSSCFIFTALFFALPVLLNHIVLSYPLQLAILDISIAVTYIVGPVTAPNRPPLEYKMYQKFRLISTGLVLAWSIIIAFARVFPYQNICFWVITLQTIQLICAKPARKGDIYEKTE